MDRSQRESVTESFIQGGPEKRVVQTIDSERQLTPDQQRAEQIVSRTRKLDENIARILIARDPGSEQVKRDIETIDVLSYGEVGPESHVPGQGVNKIEARFYVPPGRAIEQFAPVEAVVKPEWGEVSYGLEHGQPVRYENQVGEDGLLIERAVPLSLHPDATTTPGIVKYVLGEREKMRAELADEYGIPVEEVPLRGDRMSFRAGMDVGQQTRSEYTASRIDRLCGLNTSQLSALRKEGPGFVLAQEKSHGRRVDKDDIERAVTMPPDHPMAKSLVRMACLDYLIGSMDRSTMNMLFDEERQAFVGIDEGQSSGFSKKGKIVMYQGPNASVRTEQEGRKNYDGYMSVAIEAAESRPDWVLDEEAWNVMKGLLEQLEKAPDGETANALGELFRFQYGHDVVAQKEFDNFKERLQNVVRLRRVPPMVQRSDFRPEFPLGFGKKRR